MRQSPGWLWLNLLGLDAPLIALVWQDYLGRVYPSTLHPAARAVLGLTVWAIYLADRLLDVREPALGIEKERHRFCRAHRAFASWLLALVLFADAAIALIWLRPLIFRYGLFVLTGVVGYFAAYPVSRRGAVGWKKPLAALLFTAGIFIVARTAIRETPLVLQAAAFFALCLSNLLLIEHWEQGREPGRAWIWIAILALSCFGWFWPVSISAAGLGVLSFAGKRMSPPLRCVLADAVLLSPLLFR